MAKMTPEGQDFVSDEISHLVKDGPSKGPQKGKKMPQKQAIAVALDVARRKGFKSSKNPNEGVSIFDKIVNEAMPPPISSFAQKPTHWSGSQSIPGRKRELQGHLGAIEKSKQGITAPKPAAPKPLAPTAPPPQKTRDPRAGMGPSAGQGYQPGGTYTPGRRAGHSFDEFGYYDEFDTFESRQYRLKDRKDGAMSIFDGIVKQESTKSLFDGIVDAEAKSLFDGIVESPEGGASLFDEFTADKPAKAEADWDDRVARTMILAEELIELRSSAK